MKCKEIYERLKRLEIPVAYSHFNDPPNIPFVVYTASDKERHGADDVNLLENITVRIELYTDYKDEECEDAVASLFDEYEMDISESYISDQQLYQVVFEFTITNKLQGGKYHGSQK